MTAIFRMRCESSGYTLGEAGERKLREILAEESKDVKGFGNARGVRNLFESAIASQADRLAEGKGPLTRESLMAIRAEDLIAAQKQQRGS